MIKKIFIIIVVIALLVGFCSFVIRTVNFEELFLNSEESEKTDEDKNENSGSGNNTGGNDDSSSGSTDTDSGSTDSGNTDSGSSDSGNTGGDSSGSGNTGNEDESQTFTHYTKSVLNKAYINGAVYDNGTAECFDFSEMNYLGNSSFVYSVFNPLEITDDIDSFTISFTLSGGSDGSCVGLIMQPIFRDYEGAIAAGKSIENKRIRIIYNENLERFIARFIDYSGLMVEFQAFDFPAKFDIVFERSQYDPSVFYYNVYINGEIVNVVYSNSDGYKIKVADIATLEQYRFYMTDTGTGEYLSVKDFKVTYTK